MSRNGAEISLGRRPNAVVSAVPSISPWGEWLLHRCAVTCRRRFRCRQNYRAGHRQEPIDGRLIWGVSSASHEVTEIDRTRARYYNTDLAEYLIPVNADIDNSVVILTDEKRLINEIGIKGLGELGNVSTNAAVANAVFHATDVRILKALIRLESCSAHRYWGGDGYC